MNDGDIVIFPATGKSIEVHLPISVGSAVFAANGNSVYGEASVSAAPLGNPDIGIYKVELNPIRTSLLTTTSRLPFTVVSKAVSADESKIVVLGFRQDSTCGIFEILLPDLRVMKLLDVAEDPAENRCQSFRWWPGLSLSPDAQQAVAVRKDGRLEVIDLARTVIRTIGSSFDAAWWSPDGHWIAAVQYGDLAKAVLLETSGFTMKRTFTTSTEIAWSPDSRHLLTFEASAECVLDEKARLVRIDVANGERTPVENAPTCRDFASAQLGWVRADVRKP
jgi:hypothetical protein